MTVGLTEGWDDGDEDDTNEAFRRGLLWSEATTVTAKPH